MIKLFLLILIAAGQLGNAHKILIGNVISSTSHMIPLASLAEGLLEQGHQVTFAVGKKFSVIPKKAEQLVLPKVPDVIHKLGNDFNSTVIQRAKAFSQVIVDSCEGVSNNEVLATHMRENKYDVFIVSAVFQQCLLTTLLHYQPGVPYILFFPGLVISSQTSTVTGYHPWDSAYIPVAMHAVTEQMTFKQRIINLMFKMGTMFLLTSSYWPMDAILVKNLGEGLPSVNEIEKNASFLFINSNFEYEYPLPVTPDVVMTGCMQCRPGRQLPQKIRKFIDGYKKDGVIVFSLGSVVSASNAPFGLIDKFIEAFKDMPQGVIFHTDEKRQNLPKNMLTQSWLPMQDVLADPSVKVIISHGGYMTLQETMYHGVPYLGLPLMGKSTDRLRNVLLAEYRGTGLYLDVDNITKSMVLDNLNQLLNNKRFKENALRVSSLLKNKMATPRDEAVYKVNFAIRHKDNNPYKIYARNLTTIQYYSLDVVSFLLIVIIAILYVLLTILRLTWRLLRYICGAKKLKQQ